MNILVTGGSGFIGKKLCAEFKKSAHNIFVTSRRGGSSEDILIWNPPQLISSNIISNIDVVINLAGEPIAPKRWTEDRKRSILASRINATRAIVRSIERSDTKPKLLISASAVGYYGAHEDEIITEEIPAASDYLADVCVRWEAEALKAEELGVRVVTVRLGGVLEADGGALAQMVPVFKFFLGGPLGNGNQWFPWIHLDDVVGIIIYALENEDVSGPVNATAPDPVTNKEFSNVLGRVLGRPSCLTVPAFVVEYMLGELSSVLLTGQRVVPEKILKAGYKFKYPELNEALTAIFHTKEQVVDKIIEKRERLRESLTKALEITQLKSTH